METKSLKERSSKESSPTNEDSARRHTEWEVGYGARTRRRWLVIDQDYHDRPPNLLVAASERLSDEPSWRTGGTRHDRRNTERGSSACCGCCEWCCCRCGWRTWWRCREVGKRLRSCWGSIPDSSLLLLLSDWTHGPSDVITLDHSGSRSMISSGHHRSRLPHITPTPLSRFNYALLILFSRPTLYSDFPPHLFPQFYTFYPFRKSFPLLILCLFTPPLSNMVCAQGSTINTSLDL